MKETCPQKIRDFLGEEICQNLPNSFPELYQRIAYIILKFLQSEEKILFLQFPLEDLTNKEKKKGKYWDEICDVITYAVRLSMKSGELQPSKLSDSEESYPGEWYKKGDTFLLLSSEEAEHPYYFLQAENDKITFSCLNPKFAPPKTIKNSLIQNARAIYKLKEIPGQVKNGYRKCLSEIELLSCKKFENEQLSSAVAICTALSGPLPHAGTYVKPVVDVRRANPCYPDSDILAIVGDKAFGLVQGAVNSLEPNGPTKKLIVFGTQHTVPLRESQPATITFSFQEMHKYCSPKKVKYFDPEFIEIKFPWLKGVLAGLKGILEGSDNQLGDTSKHIYNLTRSTLADIEFSREKLEKFKEYFLRFLDDRIEEEDSPEFYGKIMVWLDNLSYDSDSNPKRDYAGQNGGTVILYDRSISRQLKGKETYGSKLILDSPYHACQGDNNPITAVMRYHLFPKLSCLYYEDIETPIMNRAKRNIDNDPFFSADAISAVNNTEDSVIVNLEDYFDLEPYQRDFYSLVYGAEKVVFTDGSSEQLSGEVILSLNDEELERVQVANIMDKEGETIIFYSQNTNNRETFNHLVNGYYNFPEGKDVDYYAQLWQNALRTLIEQTPKEALESLCKELKISKAVLNNHIEGRSKFMQRKKFDKVLDVLIHKGLINEDEKLYIKAAKNFYNSSSISFGSQLKDALYRFRINENDRSEFLQKIEENTEYTAANLVEYFLYTKTIKNIT